MASWLASRLTRRRIIRTGLAVGLSLLAAPRRSARAAEPPGGLLLLPRAREIALVTPDGSEDRAVVTLQPGEFVADVAFSPDRKRVAFGLFTAGTGDGAGGSDIVMALLDDDQARTTVVPRDRPGMLLAAPHWSPDGMALVFEAVGLSETGQASVTAEWIGVNGGGRRVLAQSGRYPSFSPDGKTVVYTRALPTGDALWVQPLDGGEGREIVSDSAFLLIAYPRFSPDGKQIAFAAVSNAAPGPPSPGAPALPKRLLTSPGVGLPTRTMAAHGFPAEPYVVPVAGGEPRRLAPLPVDDAAISWSPAGHHLAVSGANGLFLVGVADASVQRVSESGSFGAIDWR